MLLKKANKEMQIWDNNIHLFKIYLNEYDIYKKKLNLDLMDMFKKNKSIRRYRIKMVFKNIIQSIMVKGKYLFFQKKYIKFFQTYVNELFKINYKNKANINLILMFNFLNNIDFFFKHSYHRIDKKIRKFSRGKSGKYTIKFNYIPPFKRFKYKLKLVKQEMKLVKGKNFTERLLSFHKLMDQNFENSNMNKNKHFAYKKIYRDYYPTILMQAN